MGLLLPFGYKNNEVYADNFKSGGGLAEVSVIACNALWY